MPWVVTIYFIENILHNSGPKNVNKFQNPFRRPLAMSVFLFGTAFAIWFGIGACLPITILPSFQLVPRATLFCLQTLNSQDGGC